MSGTRVPVEATQCGNEWWRVRVWVGEAVIADKAGDAAYAERYAASMRRKFPECRVTKEPLSGAVMLP